jgi:AraC-like DNA-binding protein
MNFERYIPGPPLDAYIDCVWRYEGERSTRELALPTGTTEIVFNLLDDRITIFSNVDDLTGTCFRGAVVCGVQSRYFVLSPSKRKSVFGVHFRPGGAAPFLGPPLSRVADQHLALDNVWGSWANALRERLMEAQSTFERFRHLERALLAKLEAGRKPHPAVVYALREFTMAPCITRVQSLVDSTGYSAKRFIRLFTDGVGLAPKRYCRIRRLQSVIGRLAKGDRIEWARVAATSGYCDQSHLIRDFRAMTGLTPSQYAPVNAHSPNHVALKS